MTHAIRAVLDTNVLVSALVFRQGAIAALRESWQGHCPPVERMSNRPNTTC
jgi:hypothetical protein